MSLSELVRIDVCLAPTDMRKSFDSLAALVQELSLVLWGIDPASVKRQKRYAVQVG